MASTDSQACPISVPVPFTVTVNTSGTAPHPLSALPGGGSHPNDQTNGGFTRISKFGFSPELSDVQSLWHQRLSDSQILWNFGDGYTLSAANTLSAEHTYNAPGEDTVNALFFDNNGETYTSTFTETVTVYNYIETNINVSTTTSYNDGVSGVSYPASKLTSPFTVGVSSTWQDHPEDDNYTLHLASSGSESKPYDTQNKYAHLVPFNAFYNDKDERIKNNSITFNLNKKYYAIDPSDNTIHPVSNSDKYSNFRDKLDTVGIDSYFLGSVTAGRDELPEITEYTISTASITSFKTNQSLDYSGTEKGIIFKYYDDTPNTDPGIRLLTKINLAHRLQKNFYIDGITEDINSSGLPYMETQPTASLSGFGTLIYITKAAPSRISFTSTGMKPMSGIQYKRQGDKFQLFVSLADTELNILKHYPVFSHSAGANPAQDNSFYVEWSDGTDTHTSVISSLSTKNFGYDTAAAGPGGTTGASEISSFAYLNIDPLSAGTWTLNVTGRVDSFTTLSTSAYGNTIDYDNSGPYGNVSIGVAGAKLITGSYTFTVAPSTNDVELYKKNEDFDYSETIKSYRFQSFLHEYDDLFDGVFTAFVGSVSSSPTTFGKTIFERIANFVDNHSDVDLCNINNLQSFYDLFNEDIDIVLPTPPPELKRLYDLFSIKITKLIGDYEKSDNNLNTNFYTNSADGRNVDFQNPIDPLTYNVTAYTDFVARQKFNNEFIVIKPLKVAFGSLVPGGNGSISSYPLSTYNVEAGSQWGWPLDSTVSSASGLSALYEFYPYTSYDSTSANENIKNSVIDFDNPYTTITRSNSSIETDWEPEGGIIYKNLDYQIRKGLSI